MGIANVEGSFSDFALARKLNLIEEVLEANGKSQAWLAGELDMEYASDAVFLKELKNAQLAWIKLRDADVKMMYPDREPGFYGSMHPMCYSNYMEKLTRERTEKLRLWLDGSDNGCTSSVN